MSESELFSNTFMKFCSHLLGHEHLVAFEAQEEGEGTFPSGLKASTKWIPLPPSTSSWQERMLPLNFPPRNNFTAYS